MLFADKWKASKYRCVLVISVLICMGNLVHFGLKLHQSHEITSQISNVVTRYEFINVQEIQPNSSPISGYTSLDGKGSLRLNCSDCSLVFASGILLSAELGSHIDQRSCVFRTNNSPTNKYEQYVGSKTTVRVVSHSSVQDVYDMLQKHPYLAEEATKFVVWGHQDEMQPGHVATNRMEKIKQAWPSVDLYKLTDAKVHDAYQLFEAETKINMTRLFLTTGWFTVLLALDACNSLHFYGMVDEEYCKQDNYINFPYHYYNPDTADECDNFFFHAKFPYNAHRYFGEKRIFKKWAQLNKRMFFHLPKWSGL